MSTQAKEPTPHTQGEKHKHGHWRVAKADFVCCVDCDCDGVGKVAALKEGQYYEERANHPVPTPTQEKRHVHVFKGEYGKGDDKQLQAYCDECGEEMDWPTHQPSEGWDEAINNLKFRPILYTDVLMDGTEKARQTCRDDLWAISTQELESLSNLLATARREERGLWQTACMHNVDAGTWGAICNTFQDLKTQPRKKS